MRNTIKEIFQNLERLREVPPIENNVMLLADCFLKLKKLYRQAGSCQQPASEELDPVIRVEEEGEHGEDGE